MCVRLRDPSDANGWLAGWWGPCAAAVMRDAAETVEENGIQGSATCCLVVVDTLQGRLTSANVGDSGYLLIGGSYLCLPITTE